MCSRGYWCYIDEYDAEHRSGTFENGKAYALVLQFRPKDGYALDEVVDIEIGNDSGYMSVETPDYLSYSLRTSFLPVINSIELLNLPTASEGSKLTVGTFPVTVPAGAHYTAEAYWEIYDHATGAWKLVDDSTNTVQSGNAYQIVVDVRANGGYDFAEVLTVRCYGMEETMFFTSTDTLLFEKEFSLRTVIARVEVTGYEHPAVGRDVLSSLASLSVPAGAPYEIVHAEWIDEDTLVPPTAFEKGHDYRLQIELVPKEGYEFSDDVTALVNGAAPDDAPFSSTSMQICKRISFKDVLREIRIDNVPDAKPGEASRTDITIPSGASYIAHVEWSFWNDRRQIWEPFNGLFESGKAYSLRVVALPESGFRFDSELTRFYVNGSERSNAIVDYASAHYDQSYAFGLIPIDRVEMTIAEPKVGSNASRVRPKITFTAGGNQVSINFMGWLTGNPDRYMPFHGTFKKDGQYGVNM